MVWPYQMDTQCMLILLVHLRVHAHTVLPPQVTVVHRQVVPVPVVTLNKHIHHLLSNIEPHPPPVTPIAVLPNIIQQKRHHHHHCHNHHL